jgi:outer membrane lipoprotein SlyB
MIHVEFFPAETVVKSIQLRQLLSCTKSNNWGLFMRRIGAPQRVRVGRIVGCCVAIVLVSGCATEPGRITGLGTATGGVLGAGFGALIGAQTGDPGTGLIVGGAAGSVAGAVVANAFEAEERYLDSNRTLMRERDQEIGRRREQLAALRTQESGRDFELTEQPSFSERKSPTLGQSNRTNMASDDEPSRSSSLSALALDAEDVRPIYVERRNGANARSADVLATQPREDQYGSTNAQPQREAVKAPESSPKEAPVKKVVKAEDVTPPSPKNEVSKNLNTSSASGRRNSWVVAEKDKVEVGKAIQPEVKKQNSAVPISKEAAPAKVILPVRKAPGLATEESDRAKIKQAPQKVSSSAPQKRDVVSARAIPASPTVEKPRPTAVPPTAVPHSAAKDVASATPTVGASDPAKSLVGDSSGNRSSGECSQAAQEIEKSVQVSEPSEKLFHYRRALRLCPADARYHIHLGDHYRSLNRFADASFEYKEALALDPKSAAAKERMEKLKNG